MMGALTGTTRQRVCARAYVCVSTHVKAYYLHMFNEISPDVYWEKKEGDI